MSAPTRGMRDLAGGTCVPSSDAAGVAFRPILDVARGVVAGFGATAAVHAVDAARTLDADRIGEVLDARATMPANTFLMVPVAAADAAAPQMRAAWMRPPSLRGVVLEIVGLDRNTDVRPLIDDVREAGGKVALAGADSAQPALKSVVALRPAIILLGRDWIRGIERSAQKQVMVETVGRLASANDAWILADDVRSASELRTLAELGVPLAQGPYLGGPQLDWPVISAEIAGADPVRRPEPGPLRALTRPVLTARSVDEASRLAVHLADGDGYVVVVDADRHPERLVRAGEPGTGTKVLAVNVDTPLAETLRRALAREPELRGLPVTVIDNAGRFLGVVSVDTLATTLDPV